MKVLITLFAFFIGVIAYSQKQSYKDSIFDARLTSALTTYGEEKMIQDELLNNRLSSAFSQVVFSNSELVDNASAFGFSQNKDKSNVSVNTNFHLLGSAKNQLFLKSGINANGSGSFFDLYSSEEWRSSVGGSVGLIFKFKGTGITNNSKNEIIKNDVLRKLFVNDSIKNDLIKFQKGEYLKEVNSYLKALKLNDAKSISSKYSNIKTIEKFFKKLDSFRSIDSDGYLTFEDYSNTSQNVINGRIIDKIIDKIWSNESEGITMMTEIIEDVIYQFDKKNIKNTGYKFSWFDANIGLNNVSYNFSEKASNIEESVLPQFNILDAEKTDINKLKTSLSFSFNKARNFSDRATFLKFSTTFTSGSFLASNLIDGTAKISEIGGSDLFLIKDENGLVLGSFDSIKSNLQFGSFDFYYAYLFGKKKVFGLNLNLSHRYKIRVPANTSYVDNYSVLFGTIFRKVSKDDDTGVIFGIDIGYDNAGYKFKAKDSFVARVRVGIPFNLYKINK